jgi:hypothetical protein
VFTAVCTDTAVKHIQSTPLSSKLKKQKLKYIAGARIVCRAEKKSILHPAAPVGS